MTANYPERARALVGTRFRPHGRSELGLDCIGVVLTTFGIPAEDVRRDYRLRGDRTAELELGLKRHFRPVPVAQLGPGDVMLMRIARDQVHLGIRTDQGFVHAHAGIGRVVETPGLPAVALSSRSLAGVRRIWADGKLIRDEDEQFKVSTTFRFYDGSEDQVIDPLVGSIEGIASTPAYRGLALAVFENLELAEFGNRIPFLTFEVVADEAPPQVGKILGDASRGSILIDTDQTVAGYAAYGRTIRIATEALVDCFGLELFDEGSVLRGPLTSAAEAIGDHDLGNDARNGHAPRIQREQAAPRSLPTVLRLSYYEKTRDYQAGEARALAGEQTGKEEQRELAAVVDATAAKMLAQQVLARIWAERDTLVLRLPPRFLGLEPGARIEPGLSPVQWTVEKCTIEGFVVVAELKPSTESISAIPAPTAQLAMASEVPVDRVSIALFDVPDVFAQSSSDVVVLLAASMPSSGWRRRPVDLSFAGQTIATMTARRKSVLGHALTALAAGETCLIDTLSNVEVELVDPDQWLTSCDDDALVQGCNLAVLGQELIQFGEAIPLGPGRFRLQRLFRGRGGTEWAAISHQTGDEFTLIEPGSLQPIRLPRWSVGSAVTASVPGDDDEDAAIVLSAESLRPVSPVGLKATVLPDGALELVWTRRSRSGWAWLNEVDAPVGENREEYRVMLVGSGGSAELTSNSPQLTISGDEVAEIGHGLVTVQVRQIGDWAASRPAELSLFLQ